jgi:hypothetical protein
MGDIVRTYDAFRTQQTPDSKPLILLSAPAVEIDQWAGVPQRRKLAGEETAGFQREQDNSRVRELTQFFGDDNNVVQNPLLGALQDETRVEFFELEPGSSFGRLRITYEDYSTLPMKTLLQRLVARLESRVEILDDTVVDEGRVAALLQLESIEQVSSDNEIGDGYESGEDGGSAEEGTSEDSDDTASVMLAEETQLVEFYTELKGRIRILELRGIQDADEIQGFTKGALLGYLKPVVLVDGQHRLSGAVKTARRFTQSMAGQKKILEATTEGVEPEEAEQRVLLSQSRRLPVSLLMDDSPSEHVFQFVVVNQKATPMGKALLGTIVSTSLSRDELQEVAERLRRAGIKLEDSQAVAYLTRSETSPFRGLVQTGIDGDRTDLLQWTVLRGLVSIFRELRGGKPYHAKVDYARAWRLEYFPQCGLVSEGSDKERLNEWSRPDGPWRDVFIYFYARVRDYFGDAIETDTYNGWGSTTKSNLFNKISLTILATDFFDFLYTQAEVLVDFDDFSRSVEEWLKPGRINASYFNREWNIEGVKKDQVAVKKLWSQNWHEYRKVPGSGLPRKFKP